MAKELHIRITDQIGIAEDSYGYFWPGFTALELEWRLQEIQNPEKVVLHISSPGGDVEEGLAIYNRLLELRETGVVVAAIVESHCYSIATLIAMAASPGELKARESSLWCVHKPMFPALYYANADDLRRYANSLDACEGAVNAAYVSRTGKPLAEVQAELRLDLIISAEQALAQGWIDGTLPALDGVPDAAATAKVQALKPVAFVRPKSEQQKQPENNMSDNKKPSKWAKFKEAILALVDEEEGAQASEDDNNVVALTTALEDGSTIYHDGELAVGTAVFTDEALETPVADGSHELSDGRTITVAEGAVTEITEATEGGEDTAAALASKDQEIADLKAQLETATATASKVTALEAEVKALKNKVPGGGQKQTTPPQNFNQSPEKKENNPFTAAANSLKRK
ncbi:Clp protease ClpP [Rufibacter latericius]|uniref:ATP-dependent Clp protease proteolytic subunit n=1 Tax=Rufibacter latericius TaxID=2487040 RepID=A0A3M9MM58_9BACT|nr:Clp protease ClpP [Rufibacter latericius]RNI26632.1 Clp protease ClpP [Rufibacter latericius]